MTQYNERKGYRVYRTTKIFEFENTKSDFKVLQLLQKKEINMSNKSYIPTRGIYLQKLTLLVK